MANEMLVLHLKRIKEEIDDCDRIGGAALAYAAECRGDARIGMTADQVLRTKWCHPDKTNTTVTASGRREQWIYRADEAVYRSSERHMAPIGYLYFDNGILTAIQR